MCAIRMLKTHARALGYLFYQLIHFSLRQFAICTESFQQDEVMPTSVGSR